MELQTWLLICSPSMSSAFHPNRFFRREEQNEGFMPSGVPAGRAPTLTADQLLTWTDTPPSHGGDKAKVSGRRSWLSPTLSYSDDPAPRGTLSLVGSIFNLLTVPRAEPQGSSQAQRQPHWLAPTPSFASCTPIGCCWKDFKIASGFRLARRPSFCSAVLTMSSANTFSFITYLERSCTRFFPACFFVRIVILVRARPCSPHSSPNKGGC